MTVDEHKVLVIGLDAATFDLILPWAAEGKLPQMARLLAQGAHGPLRSVPNLNSLSAWTTFMTGVNPGRHGVYWFYERKPASYDIRFLNGGDIAAARFWEIAGAAGKRVGVINVPMTFPAKPVNGFLIAGMDAPDESSAGFTYPPELAAELQRQGGYLIDTNILGYARAGRREQALAVTRQVIDRRARAAERLMRERPWDLFVVVFTALDRIQHAFWQAPGDESPSAELPPHQAVSDAVLEFYQRLDAVVGRLVEAAGEGASVMLVSDHGMGANPQSNMYLNPWLESLGLFHKAADSAKGQAGRALRYLLRRAAALADGLLGKRWRRRIMRLLPGGRAGLVSKLHRAPCDWSRTRAYADYIQPGIWINLRGREPQGIVEPGEEYEALRARLIALLSRCRDPRTGAPIVRGVYRREEVYRGPRLDQAPDLHIEWNYDQVVSGYQFEDEAGQTVTVGSAADIVERRNIDGDHRPDGIFLLAGPGARRGGELAGARIVDIAPTLLHLLGLPVPEDMEGRVLTGALSDEFAAHHPIQRGQATPASEAKRELSDDEARQVESRLRGLGYLE